jgi:large subunit ribosomal protein L35
MPKMKSHRGAAKRFQKTSSGRIKRFKAYASHGLVKKSAKRKRNLTSATMVDSTNVHKVKVILPYLKKS